MLRNDTKVNSFKLGEIYSCDECGFCTKLHSEDQLWFVKQEEPLCDCIRCIVTPLSSYYLICGDSNCNHGIPIDNIPRLVGQRVRKDRGYFYDRCVKCGKQNWFLVKKAHVKHVPGNWWHNGYTYKYSVCECTKEVRLPNLMQCK